MDFEITIPGNIEKIFQYSTDYENFKRFLPNQIKDIKVLDRDDESVTTNEKIMIKTISKKEFEQKSMHKIITKNHLRTIILEGPIKNTIIDIKLEELPIGTKIKIKIDLKTSLKYKLIQPFIKKFYKMTLTSIIYRMNTEALKN